MQINNPSGGAPVGSNNALYATTGAGAAAGCALAGAGFGLSVIFNTVTSCPVVVRTFFAFEGIVERSSVKCTPPWASVHS